MKQLIDAITHSGKEFPDVLFLDLNMPRKNGFATLGEIKRNTDLQNLPVVIFSTASDPETVKNVFRNAAHYYICKPPNFLQLKKVIYAEDDDDEVEVEERIIKKPKKKKIIYREESDSEEEVIVRRQPKKEKELPAPKAPEQVIPQAIQFPSIRFV